MAVLCSSSCRAGIWGGRQEIETLGSSETNGSAVTSVLPCGVTHFQPQQSSPGGAELN